MKKVFYAILSVFCFQPVFARVITVSNATVSPGQHSSLTAAVSAANNGDTILIHGTGINYGSITLDKSLVFIGPGHNPVDKQNTNPALLDNILLTTGSSQSRFYGINLYYIYTNTTITGILVSNCMIRYRMTIRHQNCNNWTIDGTIFSSSDRNIDCEGNNVTNLRVRNSVLNGYMYNFGSGSSYNYFTNCNFYSGVSHNTFQYCYHLYVNNCIFYRAIPRQNNGWVSFQKCLSYQTTGGDHSFSANADGVARVVYENVDPQLESFPAAGAYFNYAHDYRLKAASPVKGSGTDATDIGIFGGTEFNNSLYGYNQHGVPLNPYIKSFTITGSNSVNAGDNLQISVEAKVRN